MASGFFEGFKKIYSGKNVFAKHMFLILLSLIIALTSAVGAANTNGGQKEIYHYMYVQYPLLGIISTVISFIIGIYTIHFIHNSIKYLIWKDTQNDEEKINALDIMPEINVKIFNHFWKWLGFCIIWCIYIIIFILLGVITCFIPGFHIPGIILTAFIILLLYLIIPFIFTTFSKTYTIKGNICPLMVFTYLPKIILPSIVLYLKLFGIVILYCIASVIMVIGLFFIIGLFAGLNGMDAMAITELTKSVPIITLITTFFVYTSTIIGLSFYYAVANIYHKKINITETEA